MHPEVPYTTRCPASLSVHGDLSECPLPRACPWDPGPELLHSLGGRIEREPAQKGGGQGLNLGSAAYQLWAWLQVLGC